MRRELSWLWRDRRPADLFADWLSGDATVEERTRFFAEDTTARYIDERLRKTKMPARRRNAARGCLAWIAGELDLSRGEIFFTALALAAARDGGVGQMIAALQGDPSRQLPTLGLAQRLWDDVHELPSLSSDAHPLFARGVLRRHDTGNEWTSPVFMPMAVVRQVEARSRRPDVPELESVAEPDATTGDAHASVEIELLASRLAELPRSMQVVPVAVPFSGRLDARRAATALRSIAALTGRPICAIRPGAAVRSSTLENAALACWLFGSDLLLPADATEVGWQNRLRPFPIYVFAARDDTNAPAAQALPTLTIAAPDFAERRELWRSAFERLGLAADPEALRETAYRFRIDAAAIADIAETLSRGPVPVTLDRMIAACRQQVGSLIGPQAALITPRFRRDELVLDAERGEQFDRLLAAMRNLSRIHAEWGTGHAWSDAGISALFAGPSGTGKTMAAEVLAAELDVPMYRIDLSQIMDKYIGETEKNLRRLFDAAEQAEVLLFFDEADSVFGQRVQTRTANDRFANMDVSYLLERMDRFRGLAILATNRKKDIDEAFLRRLRYTIEFPIPSEAERKRIWRKTIPPQVSTEQVDFDLLAREFALAGGNIRSIVLNACLAAAALAREPALRMEIVMDAVHREYEKIGRPFTREQKDQWVVGASAARPGRLGVVR
jgi:vesicle-fusing ATPase